MRTDMGLLDRLFGEKTTLRLPQPDGSVREVEVTVRWLDEMVRLGKIQPEGGQIVQVHILDPQAGLGQMLSLDDQDVEELGLSMTSSLYRVEEWTIGTDISAEQYKNYRDSDNGDLYLLIFYKGGKPNRRLVQQALWNRAREEMSKV